MDNNMENNKVVIDFEVISAVFMTIIMMAVIAVVVGVGTVGAVSRLHVAAALFGTTVVPSFLGHLGSAEVREAFFT